jgi:putative transcriptional regulator
MEVRLGNRLKEARLEMGLTQAELALRVGVSRKTINTIENAVFTPSATLALALARAFERPVEALFFLVGELGTNATPAPAPGVAPIFSTRKTLEAR